MHQNNPITYEGFDSGTGHTTRAVQTMVQRLKNEIKAEENVTDDAAAPPAKKRGIEVKADEKAKEADAAPPIKKRGRPTKASQEVRIIPQLVSDDREQN